jgi:hypothetical protein
MKTPFDDVLQRRARRRNLQLDLDTLAADPRVAKAWLFENAAAALDALGVDRSRALTAEDLLAMLTAELEKAHVAATTDLRSPTWSEVEEAVPGRMTSEELQNVLAGGTRKRRPG